MNTNVVLTGIRVGKASVCPQLWLLSHILTIPSIEHGNGIIHLQHTFNLNSPLNVNMEAKMNIH